MSSQAGLGEFDGQQSSVGQRTLDASHWDPTSDGNESPRKCNNCGQHVGTELARVLGSEDGGIERCLGCAPMRQLVEGAGAGKDVPEARSQITSRGGGWNK